MDTLRATPTWVLPVAIIAAGVILAVAIYAVRVNDLVHNKAGDPSIVRPVTPNDHLVGNPTASVIVVEYGDMDSEYTKEFNSIMAQIMTEHGTDGQVAWVFRHFPVLALHPYSAAHASAAECVAAIAGPEAFWGFMNGIAARAPGATQFDPRDYESVITGLNVPTSAFTKCVVNGTHEKKVQDDYTNAILSGGEGAPYIILMVKGQKPIPISGALPYVSMKKVLEEAIKRSGT